MPGRGAHCDRDLDRVWTRTGERMTFTIVQGADAGSLRLSGELDVAEADGLIERAEGLLPANGDLVLELEES
jgi:hypothetical protein